MHWTSQTTEIWRWKRIWSEIFSFNVTAADANQLKIKTKKKKKNFTIATLLPLLRLPNWHILIHMSWKKCSFFIMILFSVFVFFCRQGMSFAISVLKLPLYLSSCYFQIDFFCLIYWFHCTNVLLFCVSYFIQWPLSFRNKRWYLFPSSFLKCKNMLPHIPLYLRLISSHHWPLSVSPVGILYLLFLLL